MASDIVGPLPKTPTGNKYIIVFTEYLTKYVEAFPIPDCTAKTTAKIFVEKIICRYSAPAQLLTDRGTNYMSELIQQVCQFFDTKKLSTSPYHPQTDGLVERFNKTMCTMLSMYVGSSQKDWDEYLPFVIFAYNSTEQKSTQYSPFELLFGRKPILPIDRILNHDSSRYTIDLDDYYLDLKDHLNKSFNLARLNILKSQDFQANQYNKKVFHPEVLVGSMVMLHEPHTPKGKVYKLRRPWSGPYPVINIRYPVITLKKNRKIFNVHINRTKLYHPHVSQVDPNLQSEGPE